MLRARTSSSTTSPARVAPPGAALLLLAGLAATAPAQEPASSVQAGTRLLQEGRFAEAVEVLRGVTASEPGNAVAWYRLGMALQEGGMTQDAIGPLERAAELGFQTPYARARIARAHAALGHDEVALATLETAVEEGLDAAPLLEHDDFGRVSGTGRFGDVLAALRRNADPCTHIEAYHAFDFWLGEWDVFDPAGQQVGENRIERLLGSCALQENWTDARGSQGKSLNVYDRSTGLWRQLWVTDRGNVMDYGVGRVEGGAMRLEGTALTPAGDTVHRRMVFTPVAADTVRQEIFQSTDGGATWTSSWLGIYVRRGAGTPH